MSYTLKEAKLLVEYYSDKMIGEYLDDSKQVKIKELKIDPVENDSNSFLVRANGHPLQGVAVFFREIGQAAKQLNLPSPEVVLKASNQSE